VALHLTDEMTIVTSLTWWCVAWGFKSGWWQSLKLWIHATSFNETEIMQPLQELGDMFSHFFFNNYPLKYQWTLCD